MSFDDHIKKAVTKYDSEIILKPKQLESLSNIYDGKDCIVNLPTGFGKSLIFHLLPCLFRNKLCLKESDSAVVIVVCPLNVIQEDQIIQLNQQNIPACRIDISGQVLNVNGNGEICLSDLDHVRSGFFDIVFCHPESLFRTGDRVSNIFQDKTFVKSVVAIVIDECHKVEEWSTDFRQAFKEVHTLKAYFPSVPFIALSGTLVVDQIKYLDKVIGLVNPVTVSENPDRPNIYFNRREKLSSSSVVEVYEDIFETESKKLFSDPYTYPVTLLYLPLEWCSEAASYCEYLFGGPQKVNIYNAHFGVLFSNQDKTVVNIITDDLKKSQPRFRLIFCTSCVGMGFNAKSIEQVIHGKPPRNISDYYQQVGRCGRAGQKNAQATLFFNSHDIARNLPGIKQDIIGYCKTHQCLRDYILKCYGFEKNEISPQGCKCCCICKQTCMCDSCSQSLCNAITDKL